jgi:hypothetical protein
MTAPRTSPIDPLDAVRTDIGFDQPFDMRGDVFLAGQGDDPLDVIDDGIDGADANDKRGRSRLVIIPGTRHSGNGRQGHQHTRKPTIHR